MSSCSRAFSFVDRITALDGGLRVRGSYTIPGEVGDFPISLVAEAVGQLAAWAAMATVDFQARPLAGLGGAIELLAPLGPGRGLELSADLESVDADAVAYGGLAMADGVPVLRLQHCVGPMLPMDQFDDPAAMRERFALLRGAGVRSVGFAGLPSIPVATEARTSDGVLRATLNVPATAHFFSDHFPRRPLFPGSLLMHLNLGLATELMSKLSPPTAGGRWRPSAVRDMKLRAFIAPGDALETQARLEAQSPGVALVQVQTRQAHRLVGGARVEFVPEAIP